MDGGGRNCWVMCEWKLVTVLPLLLMGKSLMYINLQVYYVALERENK